MSKDPVYADENNLRYIYINVLHVKNSSIFINIRDELFHIFA